MKATRTIIEPPKNLSLRLSEIWQYRELFYFFTWRDIKVKYKQTYFGILWAVLQPLMLMMLFTFVFSKNLQFKSGPIRYEVFVLSGLILWSLFYAAVSHAAQSIVDQSNVIRKIYFPRLIIPSAAILTALFDFMIAFILFLFCCILFRQSIAWSAIYMFPLALLLLLLSAFGAGTFLSALTVKYRDFRYALPFMLQFLFFASTVLYSLQSIRPAPLRYLFAINPVNGAIEMFRNALGGKTDETFILISAVVAILLCMIALLYFRKTEAYFADLA